MSPKASSSPSAGAARARLDGGPVLRADALRIGHHGLAVGGELGFALASSELVCLLGPNGAGKTTLLRTLAGLHAPVGGAVEVCGEDLATLSVRQRARRVAVVLTGRPATGALTVEATVALGRQPHTSWNGRLKSGDRRAVERALHSLQLEELADRPLEELSDGEAQRALVARAVAQETDLLLLDEPTAFLDLERRSRLFDALVQLTRERGLTVVVSTHDLELAMARADRVLLMMSDRLVVGAPEDVALDGAFENLLGEGDLRYDDTDGRFRRRRVSTVTARVVSADRKRLLWARRMVERLGFDVLDEPSGTEAADVVLEDREDGWQLLQGEASVSASTLGEAAGVLRRELGAVVGRSE